MWEFWHGRKPPGSEQMSRVSSIPPEGLVTAVSAPEDGLLKDEEHFAYTQDPLPSLPMDEPHIYFKDLKLLAQPEDADHAEHEEEEQLQSQAGRMRADSLPSDGEFSPSAEVRTPPSSRRKLVDKQRLIIILVGLPARGKTFLCNKLMCYLNWLGHTTRHFNVGNYRRKQQPPGSIQNADFFDIHNQAGMEAREKALIAALDDLESWLCTEGSQVAIFDATNSTHARRDYLRSRFHGRWQYMYLESICNDTVVLEHNYKLKLMYSPDYRGMSMEEALKDFHERINKYSEVYETIEDRTMHYVKLIDMVTGRGYMDVNRISGYISGKMVFFLMQVCKAGVARPRRIWMTRHGESQYNTEERIGGNSYLSDRGQVYAALLPDILNSRVPVSRSGRQVPVAVWTSTLARTIATAADLPFPKVQWKALDEIQAGACDGMTYREIKENMPDEYEARRRDKLRYRYPFGESYMDVIQRLEPVVIEVEREREAVCIVAHQAVLRALYAYFMNKPIEDIPNLDIPLHTLIELAPKADGTMAETRFKVNIDKAIEQMSDFQNFKDGAGRKSVECSSEVSFSMIDGEGMPLSEARPSSSQGMKHSLSMAELSAAEVVEAIHEQDTGYKSH